jgi:hypothetical protein
LPGGDIEEEKAMCSESFRGAGDQMCFTMRRLQGRGLSFGTSAEQITPESLTPDLSGFVHPNISRLDRHPALDQVPTASTRALFLLNYESTGRMKREARVNRIP